MENVNGFVQAVKFVQTNKSLQKGVQQPNSDIIALLERLKNL